MNSPFVSRSPVVQTGVCSVDLAGPSEAAPDGGCCGGPAKADASACCR